MQPCSNRRHRCYKQNAIGQICQSRERCYNCEFLFLSYLLTTTQQANQDFTIQMAIRNLNTGNFVKWVSID